MLNIKWTNLDEIIIHISKFNNKILLNIIINELNNLESNKMTENKIKLFNEAINELVDRKQEVMGDIDWGFNHYNENGPYRKINKS